MNFNIKKITQNPYFLKLLIGKEIGHFLENLVSLMSAKISIIEALDSLREEARSDVLKKIIKQMKEDVENGDSLSVALKNTNLFSSHVASLIDIGERSGNLTKNLKIIATEEEKRRKLSSKIRSASMYPLFVIVLTLIIGVGIAWFILPKLTKVFSQLDIDLPLITKILIDFGSFLETNGLIAMLGFFVFLFLIIYLVFFFKKTKIIGEYILFILPCIKKVFKESEISKSTYLLGTLVKAGVSPVEACNSLAEATSYTRYRRFYKFLAQKINEGYSFRKSFEKYKKTNKLMPLSVQQLIFAGEKTGTFGESLIKISENYELKTDISAKNLAVMLEPILLLVVWVGVVLVALAVILPIYSLVGDFNRGL